MATIGGRRRGTWERGTLDARQPLKWERETPEAWKHPTAVVETLNAGGT